VVRLVGHCGALLEVEEVGVLDGTPLLDIKPYVPDFDCRADARSGWYDDRPEDEQLVQAIRSDMRPSYAADGAPVEDITSSGG